VLARRFVRTIYFKRFFEMLDGFSGQTQNNLSQPVSQERLQFN
jgi:hypothetical protein